MKVSNFMHATDLATTRWHANAPATTKNEEPPWRRGGNPESLPLAGAIVQLPAYAGGMRISRGARNAWGAYSGQCHAPPQAPGPSAGQGPRVHMRHGPGICSLEATGVRKPQAAAATPLP
ncbi:hypothetical protein SKAU_G00207190 [Synaphobranchus kaupii]|uniref:Uncharacterized protein n=1 Tax=Synaphobranchus kaupii TaxID=118154 RepID=A0A9Q1F8E3_SYNKA|nr:hypothetical protein SKAU_G00207190 [Synaphobranchus kaupii]